MNRWRYAIDEDVVYAIARYPDCIRERRRLCDEAGNCWLELVPPNRVIVKAGYAWDGCSPTFSFLDLGWVGTPDGVIEHTGRPVTWKASLVHDALGQYRHHENFPFDTKMRDLIFRDILAENEFKMAWTYYWAVRFLGPVYDWYINRVKKAER